MTAQLNIAYAQVLEGDRGDGGGVLLGGVGGLVVEAAFVAAADHVEDGPGEGVEGFVGLGFDLADGYGLLQDGYEGVVAGAEDVVGLAAVFLFAAHRDDEAVEVLVVQPEFEADGDGDGELVADAVGSGYALGYNGL